MRIGVASGKGGTGKTLVSVSLTRIIGRSRPVQYLDCDVEEPNGHLFLRPRIKRSTPVMLATPAIDADQCDHCGECATFCRFGALAAMPARTIVFPELCHACGGCALVCSRGAITWRHRQIGRVEIGDAGDAGFVHGLLNVGEPMGPPVVEAVLKHADPSRTVIIDAPPGAACQVVATLRGCDVVALVAEPTPFGLHDLGIAVRMVRMLGIRAVVIINRDGIGDASIDRLCDSVGLPVVGRIPHDRRIAEAYARGAVIAEDMPEYAERFGQLADGLLAEGSCANW